MDQIARVGVPTWFRLGDRDLALHAVRTQRLRAGESLTAITADLCRALGVTAKLLPMTDDPVRTIIHSGNLRLSFQNYFIRLHCEVPVTRISFQDAETTRPNPVLETLHGNNSPSAIVICPSNPYLSIDPILALPGMREWIASRAVRQH